MPKIVLTPDEEQENLECCVALANDRGGQSSTWEGKRYGPSEVEQFRRMLRALLKWRKSPGLHVAEMDLDPKDRGALEKHAKGVRAVVEKDGTFTLDDYPKPWIEAEAVFQFSRLLNNRQRDLLAGPCTNAKRHGNRDYWFVRKSKRHLFVKRTGQGEFCNRVCGGDAMKARERERERERKLERARRAIANYPNRPKRFEGMTWQEFVMKDDPKISKRFLTVAVEDKKLDPPVPHK